MPKRRTSDAAKESAGTYKASRHHAQPRFAPKRPRMPRNLSKEAKAVWAELVDEMLAARILTVIDGRMLAVLCELAADWDKSREPGAKRFTAAELSQYRLLAADFGMSPAARLKAPPVVEDPEPASTWQSDEQLKKKAEASGKLIRMSSRLSGISRMSTPVESTPADTSD